MLFLQMWLVTTALSIIIMILTSISMSRILKKSLKDDYDEFMKSENEEESSFPKELIILLIPFLNLFVAVAAVTLRYKAADAMMDEFYSKKRFTTPIYPEEEKENKEK